ncbi:hypothetical protein C0J52_05068 [Blattella germanica]|nr:hypothetical protein C0J52_05068 [Blattella germanica]
MQTISVLGAVFLVLCLRLDSSFASDNIKGISAQTRQFSLELLKTLPPEKHENVVFSPLSIYSLLVVLQQGSNGTARDELNKVLHATPEVTREALRNITNDIEQSDSVSSLRFMWKSRIKGNHNFNPEFHQVLKKGIKPRFKSGANKPASPPLKGMLSKIVQKKRKNTGVMPRGPFWSWRSITLMIVLPVEKHGLDKLVKNLTPQHLDRFMNYSAKEDKKDVELVIPTFYVNTSMSFRPLLKKMGLRSVFESGSGLTVSTDQHLYVSKITQKGQFIVDQFGVRTEEETNINFPYHFHEPWNDADPFSIDQPFIFFVVDRTYSMPLFTGRITRPQPTSWNPFNDDDDALQFPQY